MKRLTVSLMFVSLVSVASAWEFPANPDRYMSLGLFGSTQYLSGTRTEIDQPNGSLTRSFGGDDNYKTNNYGANFRIPLQDALTLTLSAERVTMDNDFTRAYGVYTEGVKATGYRVGAGLRIYFNQ